MQDELVVVANSRMARFFERRAQAAAFSPTHVLHVRDDVPPPPSTGPADPVKQRLRRFAHQLSGEIEARLGPDGLRLLVFAGCPFLGEVRRQFGPQARRRLRAALDIDLSDLPPGELERQGMAALARYERGER